MGSHVSRHEKKRVVRVFYFLSCKTKLDIDKPFYLILKNSRIKAHNYYLVTVYFEQTTLILDNFLRNNCHFAYNIFCS